jgi:2,3-bisphosphoglycerate-dependent phosphoglycerate mutase
VIPWYQKIILPELLAGENILLVAHGNSMRALVKFLDDISDADIAKFEFKFGTILIYTVKPDGRALTRDELHTAISQTKA